VRLTTETETVVQLPDGPLACVVRRSPRSRGMRITVHPERGVVVTIPPPTRRGWSGAEHRVTAFLVAREAWIRHHLRRQAERRRALDARPSLEDGRVIPYLGRPHRVVVVEAAGTDPAVRSAVRRLDRESCLVVERARGDRRATSVVLADWLRAQAVAALDAAIERHAPALGVVPTRITVRDPRSRWGSCSRAGRVSLSWRLILAPPAALETVVVHELCHLRVFGHGAAFWTLVASRVPEHRVWRRWLHEHSVELHAALDSPGEVRAVA